MEQLISVLIAIVIFCVVAYGLYWICTKFFPNFPPALWICGVILLILILAFASGNLPVGLGWRGLGR